MRLRMLWLAVVVLPFAACSKPTEDDCRKAILNLQKIRGQESKPQEQDIDAFVRRCRSTGKVDSVRCLINAKTPAEADACQAKDK